MIKSDNEETVLGEEKRQPGVPSTIDSRALLTSTWSALRRMGEQVINGLIGVIGSMVSSK